MIKPRDIEQTVEESLVMQAISELETTSSDQARRDDRIEANCKVAVMRGDISQRTEKPDVGHCHDISSNGCRVVLSKPIAVGDLFLIQFNKQQIQIDPSFCRCVRCAMLREDKFECGFSFFSPVQIGQKPATAAEEDLI